MSAARFSKKVSKNRPKGSAISLDNSTLDSISVTLGLFVVGGPYSRFGSRLRAEA